MLGHPLPFRIAKLEARTVERRNVCSGGWGGRWVRSAALLLLLAVGAFANQNPSKPTAITYAREIEPILKARCVVCHNASTLSDPTISGGLALDSYTALRKGVTGKGAHGIVTVGKSADSELMRRILATSPAKMMPRGGPPLPPAQIALFKRWIDADAPEGEHAPSAPAALPSPSARPMPANPSTQDVIIPTLLKVPTEPHGKETSKEITLTETLKIGPLPALAALAYSPDGKRLAVGGYRSVLVWNTTTGRPIACLTKLAGAVQSLAFRPDGKLLAVAGGLPGAAGEARVYDTLTWTPVGQALAGHTDVVYSVAWSSDGTRLATAGQDRTVHLWEWPSGKELRVFRDHSEAVTRVCFAPDGKSLYTASQDHSIHRYDAATGQTLKVFSGHADAVTALALSPDGRNLVSSGPEPRLRWWNPDSGDTTRYGDGHGDVVNDIVFSKDGKLLASASADHTVRVWDAGSAGQQRALAGSDDWLYAVALSPDSKFTAGAGADGRVYIWETATGRLRLTLLFWPPAGKATEPDWIALTPEGYFDASSAWATLLRLQPAAHSLRTASLAGLPTTLRQPQNVLKAWQGGALEPAKLPTETTPPKTATSAPSKPTK